MYKISFVVPVYNVEEYIEDCVISLISQVNMKENLEIILVDDGSKDNSLNICESFAKKYDNIKVYSQSNLGANVARNLGLEKASGEWVCFIDSDDWVENNLCNSLHKYLDEDWDVIIYSYKKMHLNKEISYNSSLDYMEIKNDDFRLVQLATLNRLKPSKFDASIMDVVSIWNKMYRRSFLIQNNLKFIPNMPKLQDLTFNLRVYEHAKTAVYINKELYNYRINPESVTHRFQKDIIQKFEIINDDIEKFVLSKNEKEFDTAFHERIVNHLRTIVVLYLCNKKNKNGYFTRKREFEDLLDKEPYKKSILLADLTYLPFKERLLSVAIKYRIFCLCEILNILHRFFNKM